MKAIFLYIFSVPVLLISCGENQNDKTKKEESSEPAFCDCVNKDYHHDGDKEKCDKIEAELKEKLKTASKDEKGDILMKIQDCKVAGQYDND